MNIRFFFTILLIGALTQEHSFGAATQKPESSEALADNTSVAKATRQPDGTLWIEVQIDAKFLGETEYEYALFMKKGSAKTIIMNATALYNEENPREQISSVKIVFSDRETFVFTPGVTEDDAEEQMSDEETNEEQQKKMSLLAAALKKALSFGRRSKVASSDPL